MLTVEEGKGEKGGWVEVWGAEMLSGFDVSPLPTIE